MAGQAKVLTQDEIDALLYTTNNPRDRALIGFLLFCGLRVSEACALSPDDIKGGMLVLPKAKTKGKLASRTIPIHPTLMLLLQQYGPPPAPYLFPGRHGRGSLHPSSASQVIQDCLVLAGLDGLGITTHSFRRTALTKLSNAGVPLRVIQQISGHKSLASLQLYLHVTPEQVEAAVLAAF